MLGGWGGGSKEAQQAAESAADLQASQGLAPPPLAFRCTVVVVNNTLVQQWADEIKKFAPGLSVRMFFGSTTLKRQTLCRPNRSDRAPPPSRLSKCRRGGLGGGLARGLRPRPRPCLARPGACRLLVTRASTTRAGRDAGTNAPRQSAAGSMVHDRSMRRDEECWVYRALL